MVRGLFRTMRPHQWVKNVFVLFPLVFARELFVDMPATLRAFGGFAVFSLFASSVYVLNDLVDVKEDREHPVKRNRPIASGQISEQHARFAMIGLVLAGIAGALALGLPFLATTLGYVVLNLTYTFGLKKVAYVDVICLAAFYELRVLCGAFAAGVPASWYLLVVTFLLASFLGFGKRAHELAQQREGATRSSLRAYSPGVVGLLLVGTGVATVVTYAVYTLDPHTIEAFGTPYLVVTTIFVLLGVLRFVMLVRRKTLHDSPTEAMLRDPAFVVNAIVGAVAILAIIYWS